MLRERLDEVNEKEKSALPLKDAESRLHSQFQFQKMFQSHKTLSFKTMFEYNFQFEKMVEC